MQISISIECCYHFSGTLLDRKDLGPLPIVIIEGPMVSSSYMTSQIIKVSKIFFTGIMKWISN